MKILKDADMAVSYTGVRLVYHQMKYSSSDNSFFIHPLSLPVAGHPLWPESCGNKEVTRSASMVPVTPAAFGSYLQCARSDVTLKQGKNSVTRPKSCNAMPSRLPEASSHHTVCLKHMPLPPAQYARMFHAYAIDLVSWLVTNESTPRVPLVTKGLCLLASRGPPPVQL